MIDRNREIKLMGIVNLTDDSFFSGSRHLGEDITPLVRTMLCEGADIIDLGGCSTRPGSEYVTAQEEWRRLEPAVRICAATGVRISVDTFRSEIVRRVYDIAGDFVVNDISAGEEDERMLKLVGELGLTYIAMHKRGRPSDMQDRCDYGKQGAVEAVVEYFRRFDLKVGAAGISNWILDPGFGFAKNVTQNRELLDNLDKFIPLGHRILVGISRKSFIWKPLGLAPEACLDEVCKAHRKALERGADILRVHDVGAAARTIRQYRDGQQI